MFGILSAMLSSFILAQAGLGSLNNWVADQLTAHESSLSAYGLLLLGGILASLLPCVYPLYPITVKMLQNRGDAPRFLHPLVYYLGIAAMYFAFGIIAALSGGAFNTLVREPLFNLTVGVVLVILGLSSAELVRIPFFTGSSGDAKRTGVAGTFTMGLSAGLLSSACVGPIVVSLLLGMLSGSTTLTGFAVLNAALKMMLFGLGVGLPLLLLGVLGTSLPRAGKWMRSVQYALAIAIVYFAYGYLEKGLQGLGFSQPQLLGILLGAALLVLTAYQFQPENLLPFQKMRRALLMLGIVSGTLVMARALLVVPTSASTTEVATTPTTEQLGNLTFYLDQEAAFDQAQQTGKLVFMDFHGDWCTNCKAFQQRIQQDETINEALQNAVLYKVYDTSEAFERYRNDPRFAELKVGLPFFAIADHEGNLVYKTNDYLATDEMALFLEN